MMKTSRGVIVFCLLTVLSVSCEGAFRELNDLNDLKEVFSGGSVPRHALILLFWFADRIGFDNNNALCVNFNPREDYHFHPYGNYDGLLDTVPQFSNYFSVGNLYKNSELIFPAQVRVMQFNQDGNNRDRIIICVHRRPIHSNWFRTVSQVFLTQHFRISERRGSRYDPAHTYIITPNLLQQLRMFSSSYNSPTLEQLRDQFNDHIDNNELNRLRASWGDDARLGLLYLIVVPDSYQGFSNINMNCRRQSSRKKRDLAEIRCEWHNCGLKVQAGENGNARISWGDVSEEQVNAGVAVALYRNQKDQGEPLTSETILSRAGSLDTSVPMNEGLQVRLHKVGYSIWSIRLKEEICRGKEFKSPRAAPVTLAQLQLFVKDGNACFRLFVYNAIASNVKNIFLHDSWVGLYRNKLQSTGDYLSRQWQWVTKFDQGKVLDTYSVSEYCTETRATPGLQARLVENVEFTRTPEWNLS